MKVEVVIVEGRVGLLERVFRAAEAELGWPFEVLNCHQAGVAEPPP